MPKKKARKSHDLRIRLTARERAAIDAKSGGDAERFVKGIAVQAALKELRGHGESGNRTHPTESAPSTDDKSAASPRRGQLSKSTDETAVGKKGSVGKQVTPEQADAWTKSTLEKAQLFLKDPLNSISDLSDFVLREAASELLSHDGEVDLLVSLAQESDRGAVLIAAAVLDAEIETLLREFIDLRSSVPKKEVDFFFSKGHVPPLRSTALKIRLAYILGLIDEPVKKGLASLQDLRSTVAAHSRKTFKITHAHVRSMVDSLADDADDAEKMLAHIKHRKPHFVIVCLATLLLRLVGDARKKLRRGRKRHSAGSSK